jgi:hypothetical protein
MAIYNTFILLPILRSHIINVPLPNARRRYWGFDFHKTIGLVFFLSFCRKSERLV